MLWLKSILPSGTVGAGIFQDLPKLSLTPPLNRVFAMANVMVVMETGKEIINPHASLPFTQPTMCQWIATRLDTAPTTTASSSASTSSSTFSANAGIAKMQLIRHIQINPCPFPQLLTIVGMVAGFPSVSLTHKRLLVDSLLSVVPLATSQDVRNLTQLPQWRLLPPSPKGDSGAALPYHDELDVRAMVLKHLQSSFADVEIAEVANSATTPQMECNVSWQVLTGSPDPGLLWPVDANGNRLYANSTHYSYIKANTHDIIMVTRVGGGREDEVADAWSNPTSRILFGIYVEGGDAPLLACAPNTQASYSQLLMPKWTRWVVIVTSNADAIEALAADPNLLALHLSDL